MKITTHKTFITIFVLSYITGYADCDKNSDEFRLVEEFRKLENRVSKKTSSKDAIENMKIVENLMLKAESSTFMGFKDKKDLAKAAKLLLAMTKLEDEKMCNREGFKIASDNEKVIMLAGNLEIVRGIFRHYIERQQKVCLKAYSAVLKRKLAIMEQSKLERLNYVMEKSMNNYDGETRDANGLFYLIKMDIVGPKEEKLYETLENLALNSTNDSIWENHLELGDLVKLVTSRDLIEPCDHFVASVSQDLFSSDPIWVSHHMVDDSEYDFYFNWVRYKFCMNAYRMIRT